jgi:endoglycosylceramidase
VIRRWLVALVVLVVAGATYPGELATSMAVRLTPPRGASGTAPAGVLPWLHVAHPAGGVPYIADDQGRMVLLHGAIPASLLEFGSTDKTAPSTAPINPIDPVAYTDQCPAASSRGRYAPLCQDDLAQMAALGFNSVRLPLVWSRLEPERGQFNKLYVDRIAQVVEWARALGMYVIIDMHQNAYSAYVGAGPGVDLTYDSGAPAWATITDGVPSQVLVSGKRETNLASFESFTNFWYNRSGIQSEYIAAVAYLAKRFKDDSTVAGFSAFNEPQPGWNLPPGFEDLLLFPFYRRVIDAVTGVGDGLPCWDAVYMPPPCGYPDLGVRDQRHLIFLDTGLAREITDFPTHLGLPISSYSNVVLSLHAYTHIYTFDALAGQSPDHATYPWGGYDQSYAWADREARAMNAALFVAEFGNDPKYDSLQLAAQTVEQEKHLVGFAFWTWKENGGPGSWGMFDPARTDASPIPSSGCLRTSRERILARVYPRASADPRPSYRYDPATGAFSLSALSRAGDPPTIVGVPAEVTGEVSSSGAVQVTMSADLDGTRTVAGTPTGGPFTISVAAANLALHGCA